MEKNINEKLNMYYNVVDYASFYVRQDRKLTRSVSKDDRENILISAINFVGIMNNCFLFIDKDDFRKETEYYYLEFANKRPVMMNEENKYAVAYAADKLELKGRGKSLNLYQVIRNMKKRYK